MSHCKFTLFLLIGLFTASYGVGATESEESLLKTIQSQSSGADKWAATRLLARVATTNSIPQLTALLAREDTVDFARYVLEVLPDSAAEDALRGALSAAQGNVQMGIITSIGVRRDSKAVDVLAPFLTNSASNLVLSTAAALGKIGGLKAAKYLEDAISQSPEPLRHEMFTRLVECADQTLSQGHQSEAKEIFDWIVRAKAPADVHATAIRGVILCEGTEGLQRLTSELKVETTPVVRMIQTELTNSEVTRKVAMALSDLEPDRRLVVIQALGRLHDEVAIQALSEVALKATNKNERLAAISASGANPAMVPVLITVAQDSHGELAEAAREALCSIQGPEADKAVMTLLEAEATRIDAIPLITKRGLTAALPRLFEYANSKQEKLANGALEAIGELATEKDLQSLLAMMMLPQINSESLASALIRIDARGGHSESFAELMSAKAEDLSAPGRVVVLQVLGANGTSKALSQVRNMMNWNTPGLKKEALRVLSNWRNPEEAPDLLEMAKTLPNETDRQLCIQGALRLMGSEELPQPDRFELVLKARALVGKNAEIGKSYLSVLGGLEKAGAVELIQPFLDDPATKREAATAILKVSASVLQQTNHLGVLRLRDPLKQVMTLSGDQELSAKAGDLLKQLEAISVPAPVQLKDYPFFPFCIDWHDSMKRGYAEQAAMLKSLGYVGMGHIWLEGVSERLAALDQAGLKLFQITMVVNMEAGKPAFDPKFKDVLALVNGRHVQFDLILNGMPPSDQSADSRAVEILNQMSDLAKDTDAQLLLYPHESSWIERIEDAVRVADKVNRPNVGVMFNVCHWLRVNKGREYKLLLEKAMPRLWAVSINGADVQDPAPGWNHYIQPLDRGDFDMTTFLKTLKQLGYKGPIGLQCYGIGGDTMEHLERSQRAWTEINNVLND